MAECSVAVAAGGWSPIVELRQYTLHRGCRDAFIDFFDSTFVETQEAVGMKLIGQFRSHDQPDRFVWLRGFPDMTSRARSLSDFYFGPIWQANRDTANGAIVDSDDVLLLRPARPGSAFRFDDTKQRDVAGGNGSGLVEVTVLQLGAETDEAVALAAFEDDVLPVLGETGGAVLAYFMTESSENTFPRLPVRDGERVLVWFVGCPAHAAYERISRANGAGASGVAQTLGLARTPQTLRLVPTSRSLLDGASPACHAIASSDELRRG